MLGADWWLRAFDAKGQPLWQRAVPGAAWAVNITDDGRLVVAAYDDGTIRWHRMDDGRELLALFVLKDKQNWVAWTPEGLYDATPGAFGVLQWQVNRGFNAAADTVPSMRSQDYCGRMRLPWCCKNWKPRGRWASPTCKWRGRTCRKPPDQSNSPARGCMC